MTSPIGNYQTQIPAGVTIQIFNPVAGPCLNDGQTCRCSTKEYMSVPTYPANYYLNDYSNVNNKKAEKTEKIERTETKKVIEEKIIPVEVEKQEEPKKKLKLTDEYIKKLESYLESKDVEKRIIAAKDILERVQEDETRKDNVALNALTNKMLKDPYQPIRFLALGMLEDRLITGNTESVEILKKIETGRYAKNGNTDQDAIKASSVLLNMTRKVQE